MKNSTVYSVPIAVGQLALEYFLPLVLLFCAPIVSGAEYGDARLKGEFIEHHSPEVSVSGNVIVGVMSATAGKALAENLLAIDSAAGNAIDVCLRITSRDGTYSSRNTYSSTSTPPILRLPYDTQKEAVVAEYASVAGRIALTTARGDCENSVVSDYYLPGALDRSEGKLNHGPLSIYINGFDATDVYYRIKNNKDSEVKDCLYIEDGRHTAFNFSCAIGDVPSDFSNPMEVEVLREVYGRELTPITIRIVTPVSEK